MSFELDYTTKKKETMTGPIVSYKGEILNLANVIYAKPISESCIRVDLVGSAGAGRQESYDIQHRQMNLPWPRAVWDELCEKAGVIFS